MLDKLQRRNANTGAGPIDKGQLILITAPTAIEYDVAVSWLRVYQPRM